MKKSLAPQRYSLFQRTTKTKELDRPDKQLFRGPDSQINVQMEGRPISHLPNTELVRQNKVKYPWLDDTDIRLTLNRNQIVDATLQFPDSVLDNDCKSIITKIIHKHSEAFVCFDEVGLIPNYHANITLKDTFEPFSFAPLCGGTSLVRRNVL